MAILLILPVLLTGAGCPRPQTIPSCQLLPGKPVYGGTLVVGMVGAVDPGRAPACLNGSERLLSHHLYETLVRIDCRGVTRPALAESWSVSNGGRTCTFTIRQGACLSDGSLVKATDVQSAWAWNERQDRTSGCTSPWTWLYPMRTQVLDDRRIEVTAPQAIESSPALFAHPSFRVGLLRQGTEWLMGSGPYRIATRQAGSDGQVVCVANEHYAPEARTWDRLVFRIREGWDSRDLSAVDVDLIVTRALSAVSYFQGPEFQIVTLLWDRNYILLAPPTWDTGDDPWTFFDWDRRGHACDLVGADARKSFQIGFPIADEAEQSSADRAHLPLVRNSVSVVAGSIVYPEDDQDARYLAGIIAGALRDVRSGPTMDVHTLARSRRDFAESLRRGSDCAYVFPVERSHSDSGLLIRELTARAPWLMRALDDPSESSARSGASDSNEIADRLLQAGLVRPLILTRPYLITRSGVVGGRMSGLGLPELGYMGQLGRSEAP